MTSVPALFFEIQAKKTAHFSKNMGDIHGEAKNKKTDKSSKNPLFIGFFQ